jgi:hypothetical protein
MPNKHVSGHCYYANNQQNATPVLMFSGAASALFFLALKVAAQALPMYL